MSGDPLTSRGDPIEPPRFDFDRHVSRFNAAVATGDWTQFTDWFAQDATLEFVGPPIGPITGRRAIHEAYVLHPPDDKIELNGPVVTDSIESVVPYKWVRTGATGIMRVTEQAGQIVRLVVTFDSTCATSSADRRLSLGRSRDPPKVPTRRSPPEWPMSRPGVGGEVVKVPAPAIRGPRIRSLGTLSTRIEGKSSAPPAAALAYAAPSDMRVAER